MMLFSRARGVLGLRGPMVRWFAHDRVSYSDLFARAQSADVRDWMIKLRRRLHETPELMSVSWPVPARSTGDCAGCLPQVSGTEDFRDYPGGTD
jgi:hypothetical protein